MTLMTYIILSVIVMILAGYISYRIITSPIEPKDK